MPTAKANNALIRRDADRRHKQKRDDSASNARPAVKFVTHGRGSALLHDRLDLRTRLGRAFRVYKSSLVQHLGGDREVTLPQMLLIDQAAKLQLLTTLAWDEINRAPPFRKDGTCAPAFDALLRSQRELRSVLETLGLKRHAKTLTLQDYLQGKGEGDDVFEEDGDAD